jgi:hypothetical protein
MLKLGLEEKVLGSTEEKRALGGRATSFSEQDLIRFFDMLFGLKTISDGRRKLDFIWKSVFIKLAKIGHVRDIEEVLRDVKGSPPAGPPVARSPKPDLGRASAPAGTGEKRAGAKYQHTAASFHTL